MCICQNDIWTIQNEFDEGNWGVNGFKDKDRFFPKIYESVVYGRIDDCCGLSGGS